MRELKCSLTRVNSYSFPLQTFTIYYTIQFLSTMLNIRNYLQMPKQYNDLPVFEATKIIDTNVYNIRWQWCFINSKFKWLHNLTL